MRDIARRIRLGWFKLAHPRLARRLGLIRPRGPRPLPLLNAGERRTITDPVGS